MNESDNQAIAAAKAGIEEVQFADASELPFDLFEKPTNKTTHLLASSDSHAPLEGKSRWYEYKFKEPCLVCIVTIATSGYSGYHEFEFSWRDVSGVDRKIFGKPNNGIVLFAVNDLCRKVSFKPPAVWFSQTEIQSISVEGIPREEIPRILEILDDVDDFKSQIINLADAAVARANAKISDGNKAVLEKAAIGKEVAALKGQQSRLKKVTDDLSDKRNELIAQNAAAEDSLESSSQRLKKSNSDVALADEELALLKTKIAESNVELKDLKGNINLFPTEIVAFVNQGSKSNWQFFWLAAVPIALIPAVFITLIIGAADLSTIFTKDPTLNINAVVLSRAPYVAICLAIITASYKIARAFILEMVKINHQRLNLTKISIIAKDVSHASEIGLNLNDEDIFRLRSDLKMQLLRDHMKDYISKDFKIQLPNQIISALGLGAARRPAKDGENASLELAVNGDGASMKIG
jgi:hypothetical protein